MNAFCFRLILILFLFPVLAIHAQVKKDIPSNLFSSDNVENSFSMLSTIFDSENIKAKSFDLWSNDNGLFVVYEKLDTLSPNDPFYKDNNIEDYTLVGLAFYVKKNSNYLLQFANDHAFFCASCNNMKGYGIELKGNKLELSISWGPSIAYANESYSFEWKNKEWILNEAYGSILDDGHDATQRLVIFPKNNPIKLNKFNAEQDPYSKLWPAPQKDYQLNFNVDTIASLKRALQQYPKEDYDHLQRLLDFDDLNNFLYMAELMEDGKPKVSKSNVTTLNDIAYYLEQANILDAAAFLLDNILDKFPNREVAHLNRADVYQKEGNLSLAKVHYQAYIRLMNERNLSSRIPKRVMDAIKL